jgi:P4 family phage/plasmid primase-like protien
MTTIADAAREYARRGWKPVPLGRKTKKPIDKGWATHPFTPAQFNGNSQNVALQLGAVSGGLVDVDLDCLDAIGLAPEFLPTTDAIFGRRSKPCSHQLYVSDLCETEKQAAIQFKQYHDGKAGPVIVELRVGANGKGAHTTVPPSMHASGELVQWVSDGEPARVPAADLKRSVLDLAVTALLKPHYPGKGSRQEGALVLGGVLARAGWDAARIAHVVAVLARAAGDDEAQKRIEAAVGAIALKANGAAVPGLPRLAGLWGKDVADTLAKWLPTARVAHTGKGAGLEDSVALDFAEQHNDDLRYVAKSSQWMRWTALRWQSEDTLAAFDLSRALCRVAGDSRAKTVAGVVALARTDRRMAAVVDQWDIEPMLFNAAKSTIDLRTGHDRLPDRLDYITKIAATAVAPPGTPHSLWSAFLNRLTAGNDPLIGFLQRFLGYCLTGHVHEHKLVFLYGTGANGKTVFVDTVAGIFGDYSVSAPIEMFLTSKYDRHPTEIARLKGARLVVAQETTKGRAWDEAKIKNLTGGDRLSARYMRGDFFDFTPTHKLLIAGNTKPSLRNVDEGIRRRILLVPFTVRIPPAERDLKLTEKLKAEWPAILRWMLDGCLEWQRAGLVVPIIVREATENYLAEQDTLAQWIEEAIEPNPDAFVLTRVLFKSWKLWCEERNLAAGTETAFSDSLAERGYIRARRRYGRGFNAITLRANDEPTFQMGDG